MYFSRSLRPRLVALALALAALVLVGGAAAQSIGERVDPFLALMPAGEPDADGWYGPEGGLRMRPVTQGEWLAGVEVRGPLGEKEIPEAASVIAEATGAAGQLEGPIATFLRERAGEFAGAGPVEAGLREFRLIVDVEGGDPLRGRLELYLPNLPEEAFPEPAATRGPEDAAHVIREFSDFQCPFCARFHANVLPLLEEGPLARDDVRFEYHHMPLESLHPNAIPAARASECVKEDAGEDAFWRFHDLLFERQDAWSDLGDPAPEFVRLAGETPADPEAVSACLEADRFADRIAEDVREGRALQVSGTPTVFVDGLRLADYGSLEVYERFLTWSERLDPGATGVAD